MKSFAPQVGATNLAPHAHRVELSGPLGTLAFPDVCPNCGTATRDRARIRKVFGRIRRRGPRRYFIAEARVPYCAACIARHETEVERMSGPRRVLTALTSVETIGAALTGGGALFIAFKALFPIGEMDPVTIAFLGLALLLAAVALGQLRLAWSRTERFAIPPQTSVTLAFDFSDDVSDVLDPSQRRVYASRDPAFAEAFAALNRDRVWAPDPAAQRTESRLKIALAVFLALAALVGWVLNA